MKTLSKLISMKAIFQNKFKILPTDSINVMHKVTRKVFKIYFDELLFLDLSNVQQLLNKNIYCYLDSRKYRLPLSIFHLTQTQKLKVKQFNQQNNIATLTFDIRRELQKKEPSVETILMKYT